MLVGGILHSNERHLLKKASVCLEAMSKRWSLGEDESI